MRGGAGEAEVEALFEIAPGTRAAAAKLEAAGIPSERELVVRRVVQSTGTGRQGPETGAARTSTAGSARPRSSPSSASDLCDIASQHESVSLTDPATHVEYLDAFGKLEAERDALGGAGRRRSRRS